MKIETERLILRKFTHDDFDDFALLMADPEVMRFSLSGPMKEKEQARAYFQKRILDHYVQYGYGLYAAIDKADHCLIGFVGLLNQNIDGENKTELGYRLLPRFWGKGLATEASLAVCHHAFDQLGMQEVISIIEPKNLRSLEVAKRIGMHFRKNADFHGFHVGIYVLKKLVLEPHRQKWQADFEQEKEKLLKVFNDLEIHFYHIGSTAIPHCNAKPIIDILGVTSDITKIDIYSDFLSRLGYQAMGEYGMKQRRFFCRKGIDPVHLHIFEDSDPEVERHLRFVAYLTAHPKFVEEYVYLKQKLIEKFPENIQQYCLGKERFIKTIDLLAAREIHQPLLAITQPPKKRHWSQEEILKAMEVNTHLQMTYFAKYVNSLELVFQPNVTVVRSNIANDTFNYILSARFKKSDVENRVPQILKIFHSRQLPFSWWVGPLDTPDTLTSALLSNGLVYKEENIGMFLFLDEFIPSHTKHELAIRKVHSLSQLKDFSDVIMKIGGHPRAYDEIYSKIPPTLYQKASCFEMYVAYLKNIPIATGILVLHANVGGIYYVATIPEQRKKGYGTAMMEFLILRAKEKGYHLVTLQASKEGKALYQRLGFKECGVFKEYAPSGVIVV